jgi:hypothetical protein
MCVGGGTGLIIFPTSPTARVSTHQPGLTARRLTDLEVSAGEDPDADHGGQAGVEVQAHERLARHRQRTQRLHRDEPARQRASGSGATRVELRLRCCPRSRSRLLLSVSKRVPQVIHGR